MMRCVYALLLALSSAMTVSGPTWARVSVVAVESTGSAAQAGVRAGDVIVGWRSAGRKGAIEHPLDLVSLESTWARVAGIELQLDRNGSRITAKLPIGSFGLVGAPIPDPVPDAARSRFERALAGGHWDDAIASWSAGLSDASQRDRCWGALRLVVVLADAGAVDEAVRATNALALDCRRPVDAAAAIDAAARSLRDRAAAAEPLLELWAVALERALQSDTSELLGATIRHHRGRYLGRRGRLDAAMADLLPALDGLRSVAPDAWGTAETLGALGIVATIRGELADAEERFRAALSLLERNAPDSLLVSDQQSNLAIALRRQGRHDDARAFQERALAIRRRHAPDSELVARSLNNLGVLAKNQGDLVAAEAHYREALAVRRELGAPPLAMASVLGNLANLALERQDPAASLQRHREVLAILEPVAPEHRHVVTTLHALGVGELMQGRHESARDYLERALRIQSGISLLAPMHAAILEALAAVEIATGAVESGRSTLMRALQQRGDQDAGSLDVASILIRLAHLDHADGRGDSALAGFKRAAELAAARAPGSLAEARARFGQAGLLWAQGRQAESLAAHGLALDAFERQRERLGGDWLQRMRFGVGFRALYVDYIDRLIEFGELETAFVVQERYRAYERRRLLAGSVALPVGVDGVMTPTEIAARLPAGTALISWLAGPAGSIGFHLQPNARPALVVHRSDRTAAEWADEVESLRILIALHGAGKEQRAARRERARMLHEALLGPFSERLARAERLVFIAEGPLHRLPLPALVSPDGRYLAENWPVAVTASASVYAGASGAPFPAVPSVVAVADPARSRRSEQGAIRSGPHAALPATRVEAAEIRQLFPDRSVLLAGSAASEPGVRMHAEQADLLHFATHAFVDSARPLDAFVQLADDAGDGRLAAWEVLSELVLSAHLVTLSACRTALGAPLGGEGVLGLSQAFLLAGARNVVATLWEVPDRSTAWLMTRFYQGLKRGLPVDRALQQAQLAVIERQRRLESAGWLRRQWLRLRGEAAMTAGPFEWAAFRLDATAPALAD